MSVMKTLQNLTVSVDMMKGIGSKITRPTKPFIVVPEDRMKPVAKRVFAGKAYFWRIAWVPWHKDRDQSKRKTSKRARKK